MKKKNYLRSDDYNIAERLSQSDKILYRKKIISKDGDTYQWIEYILHKKPVFMKHSHNWTIRAMMLSGKKEGLEEYLYLNTITLPDFRFDEMLIHQIKREQLLKEL